MRYAKKLASWAFILGLFSMPAFSATAPTVTFILNNSTPFTILPMVGSPCSSTNPQIVECTVDSEGRMFADVSFTVNGESDPSVPSLSILVPSKESKNIVFQPSVSARYGIQASVDQDSWDGKQNLLVNIYFTCPNGFCQLLSPP